MIVIAFEGIDGVGKTTQINLFSGFLKYRDKTSYVLREFDQSDLNRAIEKELLNDDTLSDTLRSVLYMTNRIYALKCFCDKTNQMASEPDYVILDRYAASTYAYQGTNSSNKSIIEFLSQLTPKPLVYVYLKRPAERVELLQGKKLDVLEDVTIKTNQERLDRFDAYFKEQKDLDLIEIDIIDPIDDSILSQETIFSKIITELMKRNLI